MKFKVFYSDNKENAEEKEAYFSKTPYTEIRGHDILGDSFKLATGSYNAVHWQFIISFDSWEVFNENTRFWNNYVVKFEDNSMITLYRTSEEALSNGQTNVNKINKFARDFLEHIKGTVSEVILADDEDFIV